MTKAHMGPEGDGHLGDLPFLTVAADGADRETPARAPHQGCGRAEGPTR